MKRLEDHLILLYGFRNYKTKVIQSSVNGISISQDHTLIYRRNNHKFLAEHIIYAKRGREIPLPTQAFYADFTVI